MLKVQNLSTKATTFIPIFRLLLEKVNVVTLELGLNYIRVTEKATSLPDKFIETPIVSSH